MFDRLFGTNRRPAAAPFVPQTPEGVRIYAIGDIHGRLDLLQRMHRMIADDAASAATPRKHVVYLGDYIDRGLESRQVVDYLLDEPLRGFRSHYLKGNHEQALLDFLRDPSVGSGWLFYGGDATLYSYQVAARGARIPPNHMGQVQAALRAQLPPRHLAFYRGLKLSVRLGDYVFVHAGIRPGVPLERQSEHDLLWIREDFLESTADHGYLVVHGHSIAPAPIVRHNRIGIDTGAYASGHLTCLVLEGTRRRFLET